MCTAEVGICLFVTHKGTVELEVYIWSNFGVRNKRAVPVKTPRLCCKNINFNKLRHSRHSQLSPSVRAPIKSNHTQAQKAARIESNLKSKATPSGHKSRAEESNDATGTRRRSTAVPMKIPQHMWTETVVELRLCCEGDGVPHHQIELAKVRQARQRRRQMRQARI